MSGTRGPVTLSILVIEDCPDSAESLALLLGMWGHQVRVAHDAAEALSAARDGPVDVVISDIALPGMNGYELAGRLRAQGGMDGTLFVAVSGFAQEEHQQRARLAGYQHLLVKPYDPDAIQGLLAAVRPAP